MISASSLRNLFEAAIVLLKISCYIFLNYFLTTLTIYC